MLDQLSLDNMPSDTPAKKPTITTPDAPQKQPRAQNHKNRDRKWAVIRRLFPEGRKRLEWLDLAGVARPRTPFPTGMEWLHLAGH